MRFCGGMIAFITFIRRAAAAMATNTAKETIVASARVEETAEARAEARSEATAASVAQAAIVLRK